MESLFAEHKRPLVAFATTITRNWEDSKDVVQEVFLECLGKDKCLITKAYLYQSVRNRSLNKIRSFRS